jgi:hypothetical protein
MTNTPEVWTYKMSLVVSFMIAFVVIVGIQTGFILAYLESEFKKTQDRLLS